MTTTTRPNKKLLLETFAYICSHPGDWYQSAWRCKSGMCFAGHTAVTILGREPVVPFKLLDELSVLLSDLLDAVFVGRSNIKVKDWAWNSIHEMPEAISAVLDKPIKSMEDIAIQALRLDREQAEQLFDGDNTLTEIAEVIATLLEVEVDSVVAQAKKVAKANGWRWQTKKLRESYGVEW